MKKFMGSSFLANLRCRVGRREYYVTMTGGGVEERGWVAATPWKEEAGVLEFKYLSQTEDRYHYAITADESYDIFASAPMGVSRNGYLGFYNNAAVDNDWKFDFTGFGEGEPYFWLRDKDGHRVSLLGPTGGPKLNVLSGEVASFWLERTAVLY